MNLTAFLSVPHANREGPEGEPEVEEASLCGRIVGLGDRGAWAYEPK